MLRISTENGRAKVFTPYNKTFVAKIKNIGGRNWEASDKCWSIPESEIDTVRRFMQEVYGETDQTDQTERVTVKVTFNKECLSDYGEGFSLFGRTIARARGKGKNSSTSVEENVTLESGKIGSYGWCIYVREGTILKIRDIPKTALDIRDPHFDISIEEIHDNGSDRLALEAEKEKLLARLAEIEKLLSK